MHRLFRPLSEAEQGEESWFRSEHATELEGLREHVEAVLELVSQAAGKVKAEAQAEAEAILDGQQHHVKAGDVVWTGVGSAHGFFNRGTTPVRWLETQAPQPPAQQSFRFPSDWEYLAEKLSSEEEKGEKTC